MFAMCLLSNRSQMISECGKNQKVTLKPLGECVADGSYHIMMTVFCDLFLNRCMASWNLCFIQWRSEKVNRDMSYVSVLH